MTYKAVLFDLDGTLLDTLTDIADAANRALRSLGLPEHSRESFRHFVGDGVETLVEKPLGLLRIIDGENVGPKRPQYRWPSVAPPACVLNSCTTRR